MSPVISCNDFSLRYSPTATRALSQLTFDIPHGSCCAVLGAASAGKSTLLQAISGLLGKHHASVVTEGSLILAGHEGTSIPREMLFPRIGLVLQDPFVMISGIYETVEAEIAFTLNNLGMEPEKVRERVNETLHLLGLQDLAGRHPRQLSGGELQRVALGTILAARPEVLLLDEPRNALDSRGQEALARILRGLHGKTTVLFSDYEIDLALAVSDYVIVLEQGKLNYSGTKKEFVHAFSQFLPALISTSWQKVLPHFTQHTETPYDIRIKKLFGVADANP